MSIGRDEQPPSETGDDWFAQGIENYMNNFQAVAAEVLEEANRKLGPESERASGEWSIHDPIMGSEFLLDCPHGHTIEQDGTCHEGCVSPLRAAGIV
jgi:hypothetical protein